MIGMYPKALSWQSVGEDEGLLLIAPVKVVALRVVELEFRLPPVVTRSGPHGTVYLVLAP